MSSVSAEVDRRDAPTAPPRVPGHRTVTDGEPPGPPSRGRQTPEPLAGRGRDDQSCGSASAPVLFAGRPRGRRPSPTSLAHHDRSEAIRGRWPLRPSVRARCVRHRCRGRPFERRLSRHGDQGARRARPARAPRRQRGRDRHRRRRRHPAPDPRRAPARRRRLRAASPRAVRRGRALPARRARTPRRARAADRGDRRGRGADRARMARRSRRRLSSGP